MRAASTAMTINDKEGICDIYPSCDRTATRLQDKVQASIWVFRVVALRSFTETRMKELH